MEAFGPAGIDNFPSYTDNYLMSPEYSWTYGKPMEKPLF